MTNRDQNNNPVRPEVFLDESYVNVNHVANKTWSTEDKVRKSKSGKGPRIVMVAAGIVTCAAHTQDGSTTRSQDEIDGPFIKESIEDWNAASKKRKGDDSSDYHGNFDSEMFAKWFTNLCTTLRKDYGPCIKYGEKDVIAQLLVRVQPHRPAPIYATQVIATDYGHLLYFTPPYHPELQPIEMVWGADENHIAANPATNARELDAKVHEEFLKVTDENWPSYYRHVQKFEDKYAAALDDCCLASEEESSECGEGDSYGSSEEDDDDVVVYSF
ncbi:hypothetical protein PF003_g2925 [Phytophthora fragariae]|nr:hypothetical protein PF003_g2925 [Phytophthora fragariae]